MATTIRELHLPSGDADLAQQKTAESMRDFEREKQFILPTVDTTQRCSAMYDYASRIWVFDANLSGFGRPGGGAPPLRSRQYARRHRRFRAEARAAWTGNLIVGEGSIPF